MIGKNRMNNCYGRCNVGCIIYNLEEKNKRLLQQYWKYSIIV
ncbi:hypothetical protein ECHLIB_0939 [Ehrlichia chaffeensis str. Liberty]|uniref:Uncharacterized protein n=1 Tax=Ehrlichia chaffeensis (strain ATCC CRL-10679 / Arkansas) TaxID=205920 RepID=Q2GHV3_EHRCR|nr:hypothetical protein ECH_0153 [Ehrlichia chaffeensis str. Arkansas]AHX05983.1 hypothetical protein ECHJAX_0936 [Ehrlichia chaffeensis str. Jax]AHX06973.1 hypothetical protein ECHLIB_0939 [Ehrlichia chaffeensis str. Liberty]AHX07511.1 hypothetical protein ECHOSC_0934 [Ehrlichia chaffeensis str. Osceola]AHX09698.1 hypothetical protein ECHWAK_0935 [Ehrlichia chaffeensis str. Wakulla]AHX10303.1 hypothetical protein ECHWP_0914 [Ehrlichia chaffeensis str. West Paces]